MMPQEKLSPEDEAQIRVMNRMLKMSELHSFSRGLLGFNPVPLRTRIRMFNPLQAQAQPANPGNPGDVEPPRQIGFGLFNRFQQLRPPQQSAEDATAQAEHKQQLVEAAEKREADEAEQLHKQKAAADLKRIKDEWGDVAVSG